MSKQPNPTDKHASLLLSKFNTTYRHSLEDILTFYGGIKTDGKGENAVANILLRDVSLNQITIGFNHFMVEFEIIKPILFESPCKSWSEVDQTLIKMAKTAAKERNLSHIQVATFVYPHSVFNIVLDFLICLLVYGHYNLDILYDKAFLNLPSPINQLTLLKPYNDWLMYGVFLLHILEIVFLLMPRLTKYRVPTDYKAEWYLFALLDGLQTVRRFDKYVNTINNDDYFNFSSS